MSTTTTNQGTWNAATIRQSRKSRGLTQAELAASLGCRQQTISEWELGMYEPKNAYQKLLSLFFGSTPVAKEEIPVTNTWEENKGTEITKPAQMTNTDAGESMGIATNNEGTFSYHQEAKKD